jgi:hypothetical protein
MCRPSPRSIRAPCSEVLPSVLRHPWRRLPADSRKGSAAVIARSRLSIGDLRGNLHQRRWSAARTCWATVVLVVDNTSRAAAPSRSVNGRPIWSLRAGREPEEPLRVSQVRSDRPTFSEHIGKTSVGPGKALSSWPHSWFFVAVSLHPASPAPRPRCKLNDHHFSRRHRDTTDQPAPALLAVQRPAELPSVLDAGFHRHILPAGPDRRR